MPIDERRRLELADAAKRALGDDAGITLMELLPPVGWADVATKDDLRLLEERLELRFDRIDARFEGVEARFEGVEARFEGVEARFEQFENRLDAKFERGFRRVIITMATLLTAGYVTTVVAALLR
jgi:hypothetical protein